MKNTRGSIVIFRRIHCRLSCRSRSAPVHSRMVGYFYEKRIGSAAKVYNSFTLRVYTYPQMDRNSFGLVGRNRPRYFIPSASKVQDFIARLKHADDSA